MNIRFLFHRAIVALVALVGCMTLHGKPIIIIKDGKVLDLGGHTVIAEMLKGGGIVSNGIIKADTILVSGSLSLPAYDNMAVSFIDGLPDDSLVSLVGASTALTLNATNVRSNITIAYDESTITNVTFLAPQRMKVTKNSSGYKIRVPPLRVFIR